MRTSTGPNKDNVAVPRAPLVSACIVTHYTNDKYHKDRMEVVRMCLDTMIAGLAGSDYELLIWDNGSTPEFRAMLRAYNPHVLIESVNVGAHNARHHLANIARGEILTFSDDDILFNDGWFSKQLEILTVFPNVGLVSGSPYRPAFLWNGEQEYPEGATVKRGKIIPEDWIRDACASVGQDYTSVSWGLRDVKDILVEYKGVRAFAQGHHMQFTAMRETIKPFMKPQEYLLAHGRKINEELYTAGLTQWTTSTRTAIHCGNYLDPRLREIARSWGAKGV